MHMGLLRCASERTYNTQPEQHSLGYPQPMISAPNDEKGGIHDGNTAGHPIVHMHIHISKGEVLHKRRRKAKPEVEKNPQKVQLA